jgi:CRISPR-associated protein Cmr6
MTEPTNRLKPGYRRDLDRIEITCSAVEHAGLWFDRYLLVDPDPNRKPKDETAAAQKAWLIQQTTSIEISAIYNAFYHRWRAALPSDVRLAKAEVQGRMVIGTGDKGVAEAGMTLHHTYGVPFIPGSALKGLAAAYAHRYLEGDTWRKPPLQQSETITDQPLTAHEILFGSTRSAGFVTFFDALYIPGSVGGNRPLAPDVITSHHSEYYVSGTKPPADWDSPIPVPFLTATGRYLIALNGPAGWVDRALTILGMALRDSGIGAKTAAGYGRMRLLTLDDQPIDLPHTGSTSEHQHAQTGQASPIARPAVPESFAQQVARSNAGSLPNLIHQWRALDAAVRVAAADLMIAHARTIKLKNLETKSWYQELSAFLANDS